MHLLLFAHFAGSPQHGMVYGHYYLAREWVKAGHEVTIVAASYAHTRFAQPGQSGKISEEIIDGIRYIWLPTPAYNPKSGIGRVKNIMAFSLRSRFASLPLKSADLVICSSHHPFPVYAARHYARKFKARLVFEVRDLWPLTLIELGGFPRWHPFIACMQKAEDYAYKHADKVVSVLDGSKEYMIGRGMDPDKFVLIPNGADLEERESIQPLPAGHIQPLDRLRAEGKFIIGYAGKIGLSNSVHTIVEALPLCSDEQIVVVILGSGPYKESISLLVKEKAVNDRVIFLDQVEKAAVGDFLKRVDATYVGAQKSPLYRYGMSLTKLNDFMLAARPVIYAVEAPGDIVKESGAGITCAAECPQALAEAIMAMKKLSPKQRDEMGTRGRQWIIANRDYRRLAEQFLTEVMR
jgi:glycosyltransferase involved in cell wall biosynthesis